MRTAGDRPLADVCLELRSLSNGTTVITSSNSAGLFRLELWEGDYLLLTATLGTQTVTNEVRVARGQNWVGLGMPGRTNPDVNSQSTVSAAELRVPEKAHNALQKARDAAVKKNKADAARYVDKAL